jgi:signal recognition particle GTPase
MRNMGGMKALLEKMPGMGQMGAQMQSQVDEKQFVRMEAVINSMTPIERRDPEVINGSRKQRIAAGSGTDVQEVNKVLKQHKQMSKMMKKSRQKRRYAENDARNLWNDASGWYATVVSCTQSHYHCAPLNFRLFRERTQD